MTELQRIADALSRTPPWWQHPWLLASLSATLGVIGGFVGQILLLRFTAFTKLRKMRTMVYADIISVVAVVDTMLRFPFEIPSNVPLGEAQNERLEHFKLVMPRLSDDYIKANPEIYFSLPERIPSDSLHAMHNHLVSEPDNFDGYLRSVIPIIAFQFKTKLFSLDSVRKYVGKEEAKSLAEILSRYDSEDNQSPSEE